MNASGTIRENFQDFGDSYGSDYAADYGTAIMLTMARITSIMLMDMVTRMPIMVTRMPIMVTRMPIMVMGMVTATLKALTHSVILSATRMELILEQIMAMGMAIRMEPTLPIMAIHMELTLPIMATHMELTLPIMATHMELTLPIMATHMEPTLPIMATRMQQILETHMPILTTKYFPFNSLIKYF